MDLTKLRQNNCCNEVFHIYGYGLARMSAIKIIDIYEKRKKSLTAKQILRRLRLRACTCKTTGIYTYTYKMSLKAVKKMYLLRVRVFDGKLIYFSCSITKKDCKLPYQLLD